MTRRQAGNIPEAALPGLHRYCDLIRHWTSRINLVAPSTLDDLWERHVLDSVQLFHVKQDFGDHYADLGSGAGLPGLVIAHLLRSTGRNCQITLVESDLRKATFLRTVNRELTLGITVISDRIERIAPLKATTLTARALAPLMKLCEFSAIHLEKDGTALFPKGASWEKEVSEARQAWQFDLTAHHSITQAQARILEIGRVRHV